jgi:hypothetical protein
MIKRCNIIVYWGELVIAECNGGVDLSSYIFELVSKGIRFKSHLGCEDFVYFSSQVILFIAVIPQI